MRLRDNQKLLALKKATVDVVNQVGFESSSIQKITKRAGISPATVYIYFANKEDLLISTFLEIKDTLAQTLLQDFKPDIDIKTNLHTFWKNLFHYVETNKGDYQFIEQFNNTAYIKTVDPDVLESPYRPFYGAIAQGIKDGTLVNLPLPMIFSYLLAPPVFLAKSRLSADHTMTEQDLDVAFSLAWKAVSV